MLSLELSSVYTKTRINLTKFSEMYVAVLVVGFLGAAFMG